MTEITRKQREISLRHELILDKARELFISQGYHSVTMDLIAKEMQYSKGTIYQHFNCKEVIISQLCSRFCRLVFDLINGVAKEKSLNPRLQMLLIQEAFILVQEICKDDVQIKNLADSQTFSTKVPVEHTEEFNLIQQQTFAIVVGIVECAIDSHQLKLHSHTCADDVAIGCWALAHGIFMLTQSNSSVCTLNLRSSKELLRLNSKLFLDGVGWDKFTLTEKRKLFIQQYSEKFKTKIVAHYPVTMTAATTL